MSLSQPLNSRISEVFRKDAPCISIDTSIRERKSREDRTRQERPHHKRVRHRKSRRGAEKITDHNNSFITKLLVVVKDLRDTLHTRITRTTEIGPLFGMRFVPIKNSAHKRGNQSGSSFSTSNRLDERKQKCSAQEETRKIGNQPDETLLQIASDSFFLQHLCCSDSFPC